MTTLRLGGPAGRFVEAESEDALVQAVADADRRAEPVFVLGGGSNVVVADEGFSGLVVRVANRGVEVTREDGHVVLGVAAGESWDALVARAAGEGWGGIEAMSGIPGLVGATPIQNVGAYGQEVRETIERVVVYDRAKGERAEMAAPACGFSYRASVFKGSDRWVVLRVVFRMPLRDTGVVRYAELARALGVTEGGRASLRAIRDTVISLRRTKGMVLDPADPESVSAGSFFVNPVVDAVALARVEAALAPGETLPRFPAEGGRTKLSAGWLVEHAGFRRGYGEGNVGVSKKHALALVNRGAGSARELRALAREIVHGVRERFGVELAPEPVFVGCRLGDV
jgi:UDP-N-acetylmuramate dehydrogenase